MSGIRTPGAVIIRSNVVLPHARRDLILSELIPGELLHRMPYMTRPTPRQHDEQMYYVPCSICRRTIMEINLTGCSQCMRAPRPAAVENAQREHRLRVEKAKRREQEENDAIGKPS
jgi:hypothetical protein